MDVPKLKSLSNKQWWPIALIFLTVLSLILQFSIEPLLNLVGMHFPNTFYKSGQVFFLDLYEYQEMAHSLLAGNGFLYEGKPTTMRSPGYPIFLAMVYPWGHHETVIFLQCVLLSFSACLYSLLSWRITHSRFAASLTGLLIICYIPYQMMALSLLADALFAFLLALFIVLFYEGILQEEEQKKWFIAAGFVLSLTTLVRPITLFFPLFLYVLFPKNKVYRKHVSYLLGVFLLVLMPWTLRNYVVTSRFVPVASTGAYNLWQGTYRSSVVYGESAGTYDPEFQQEKERLVEDDYYIDFQAEKRFLGAAIARILKAPFAYFSNCVERVVRGYLSFPGTRDWLNEGHRLRYFSFAFIQTLIWCIALFQLINLEQMGIKRFFVLLLVYSLLFHAAFNLITRYILPWLPLAFVLIGVYGNTLKKRCFDLSKKAKT